jgi:hypothetical protein
MGDGQACCLNAGVVARCGSVVSDVELCILLIPICLLVLCLLSTEAAVYICTVCILLPDHTWCSMSPTNALLAYRFSVSIGP